MLSNGCYHYNHASYIFLEDTVCCLNANDNSTMQLQEEVLDSDVFCCCFNEILGGNMANVIMTADNTKTLLDENISSFLYRRPYPCV